MTKIEKIRELLSWYTGDNDGGNFKIVDENESWLADFKMFGERAKQALQILDTLQAESVGGDEVREAHLVIVCEKEGDRYALFSTIEKASEWSGKQDAPCVLSPYILDEPEYGDVKAS